MAGEMNWINYERNKSMSFCLCTNMYLKNNFTWFRSPENYIYHVHFL